MNDSLNLTSIVPIWDFYDFTEMHLHVHLIIFITNRKERKKFMPKFTLDILFNVVVLRMVIQFYNFYNLLNQDALVSTLSSCTKNEVFH